MVSLLIILLVSFESTHSTLDALKWSLVLVVVSIAPVYLAVIYLVRTQRLGNQFIDIRNQRTKIYFLAGICALGSGGILFYFEAPLILLATFVAGLSAIVIFMCINLWWKISLHTALIASSVAVLVILYGSIATLTIMVVPLVAWARVEQERHSVAQVAFGAFLAVLIVVVVFYLFGLVWS